MTRHARACPGRATRVLARGHTCACACTCPCACTCRTTRVSPAGRAQPAPPARGARPRAPGATTNGGAAVPRLRRGHRLLRARLPLHGPRGQRTRGERSSAHTLSLTLSPTLSLTPSLTPSLSPPLPLPLPLTLTLTRRSCASRPSGSRRRRTSCGRASPRARTASSGRAAWPTPWTKSPWPTCRP